MPPDERVRGLRLPTSRTARTPSSASTTCATTSPSELERLRAARPLLRDRGRGRLDPHRRGAHAADHLGPARGGRRARTTRSRRIAQAAQASGERLRGRREAQDRRPRPRRACTRSRRRSASRTSTRPATASSSTTSIQALKAESLYKRDVEYVVQDGEVKIVDEFTGRIMEGRRWSRGPAPGRRGQGGREDRGREHHGRDDHDPELLPHVREARRHDRHGRHRGQRVRARSTSSRSCRSRPTCRWSAPDQNDLIYKTKDEKFARRRRRHRGAPREGPAGAGRHDLGRDLRAAVAACSRARACRTTCSTPSSTSARPRSSSTPASRARSRSRPTWPAAASTSSSARACRRLGGLYVLGTERHESRRIDNQLRGRSGRQGDPGETRFYLSAEDEVVRLFAGDRIYTILDRLGPPRGRADRAQDADEAHRGRAEARRGAQLRDPQERPQVRRRAQQAARGRSTSERRDGARGRTTSRDEILEWIDETVEGIVEAHTDSPFAEEWDLEGMMVGLRADLSRCSFALDGPRRRRARSQREDLLDRVAADARRAYELKEEGVSKIAPGRSCARLERFFLLQSIDARWREHLDDMDYLRDGIHLRGLAQKDPLVEYRAEGHAMFGEMRRRCRRRSSRSSSTPTSRSRTGSGRRPAMRSSPRRRRTALIYEHEERLGARPTRRDGPRSHGTAPRRSTTGRAGGGSSSADAGVQQRRPTTSASGRNDPCPCGSGKKYKRLPRQGGRA